MATSGGSKEVVGKPPGGQPTTTVHRASVAVSSLDPHAIAAQVGHKGNSGGSKEAGSPAKLPATPQVSSSEGSAARLVMERRIPVVSVGHKGGSSVAVETNAGVGLAVLETGLSDDGVDAATVVEDVGLGKDKAGNGSNVEGKATEDGEVETEETTRLNPERPVLHSGAGTSAGEQNGGTKGTKGTNVDKHIPVFERNRRFWEEQSARYKNKEKGKELQY